MRARPLAASLLVALLTLIPASPAAAADVTTIATWNPAAGELPEGLALDKRGNIYVSLVAPVSEIRKITPAGDESVLIDLNVGGLGPLGLTVDAMGRVYAGVASMDPATQGVYRILPNGTATRLPGTGAIGFANGLAFDDRGALYVTDTAVGAVWRIPRGGSASLWIQDPSLVGTGTLGAGFPVGANGIVYRHGAVIVANTELGTLVRIPVGPNGSAGEPTVIVEDPALVGADGLALDAQGGIVVGVIAQSTILHVVGDSITTIADANDGINQASSVAFGTGPWDRTSVFAVNFGIFSTSPTPALLQIDIGFPGAPVA